MAAESRLEGAGLSDGAAAASADAVAVPVGSTAQQEDDDITRRLRRVAQALRSDPHSFGFFQAVRLLERLHPERGQEGDPSREVVRLRVNPSLGFPASEIQRLDLDDGQPRMTINFMGLIGPMGVLPHQYSLLVAERLRARDTALADFLDMFHHRLLTLFYQAWRKHRFTIAREAGERDALSDHLGDLIGLGLDSTHERLPFPDEALIYRAGLLAPQTRGAVALEQMLEDFFDTNVEVQQFVGGWFPVNDVDRCAVGDDDDDGNRLGFGAVVGDEIWDPQARVRVRIGPLSREQYDSFLPGADGHHALAVLLRFFSHDQFEFEIQLVLARDDVPGLQLGDDAGQQLGWTTWIRSAPRDGDADETIFTLHTGAAA